MPGGAADKRLAVDVTIKGSPTPTQTQATREPLPPGAMQGGAISTQAGVQGGLASEARANEEVTRSINTKFAVRKAHVQELQLEARAAQHNNNIQRQSLQNSRMLSNSLLQVNMSLLGVMFGYQNFTKALNAGNTAELQTLQMKEKKTKQDKKRIKDLRTEQIQQQKLNTYMMAAISLAQFAMSIAQITLAIKQRSVVATNADSAATAVNANAKVLEAQGAGQAASMNIANQGARAGVFAPGVIAIILGALAIGATGYMAYRAKTAAHGAYVPAVSGGSQYIVGEGGEDEVISPIPKLKESFREVIREGSGGGQTVIINAIDTESFREAFSNSKEFVDFAGVN